MRFDQSFLDEIRARLPVSQVVARKVKLRKQGREYIGLSPFKQEKTPSFTVNDQKGFYHCFASGEHGDIFKFLQVTEGLSFPEAVERLAAEAGLEMPRVSAQAVEREKGRDRLRDAMEAACRYFEAALRDIKGGKARDYLQRRGVSREMQESFRLGYAPGGRHGLKEHLAEQGFTQEEMAEAGLIIAGEDIAVSYDRFRDRIIFPIRDLRGRVIAFGGRALSGEVQAKYLNSPETPLFHKGSVLFNAGAAREAAHRCGSVIVAEGYMDVIALAQAGFAHSVAPLGTALTQDQLRQLWRMASEPVLCFDGDEAGRKAAYRAIDTALPLLEPGYSLRFMFLPQGQDPDDVIAAEGAEGFAALLGEARSLADVLWMREVEGGVWDTPERRAALEDRLAALLREIGHKRVRRHYGADIAGRLNALWNAERERPVPGGTRGRETRRPWVGAGLAGTRERTGREALRAGRFRRDQMMGGASPSLRRSALVSGRMVTGSREALLLLTLLNHPWLFEDHAEEIAAIHFENKAFALLRDKMLNLQTGDKPLDSGQLRTQLSREDSGAVVAQVERAITHKSDWFAEAGASRADVETGWRQIVALHRRSVELKKELDAAERAFRAEGSETAWARLA
ncbi:MAG: DNA primase, partial [Alphaproteobacteria bacterium]